MHVMTHMTKNDVAANWEDAISLPSADILLDAAKGKP